MSELNPWEHPIGDPLHQDRDIEAQPYDRQEARVAAYLAGALTWVGTGDDPVGFLITSRIWAKGERDALRALAGVVREIITEEPDDDPARVFEKLRDAYGIVEAWLNPFVETP